MFAPYRPLFLFILIACCPLAVAAEAPESQHTAATPDEVDADYAYQGEYLGNALWAGHWRRIGLQVIARGGGQYEAVLHDGGLPGAGAVLGRRWTLAGERRGEHIWFAGEEQILAVGSENAWIYDQREPSGRLTKTVRSSPTLGLAPPSEAVVLFGGPDQSRFPDTQLSADGYLLSGVTTPMPVEDFRLHLEFRTPYMPAATGQARGNSGVYIQRRYEVQILDSFGLEGAANECGGLYKLEQPALNMCLPPLAWQTYDIHFTAARWDSAGRKVAPAKITVFHNGVAVHFRRAISTKTGAGQPESPAPLPIHLQDHGNPVAFRNVWIVLGSSAEPPVVAPSPAGCRAACGCCR